MLRIRVFRLAKNLVGSLTSDDIAPGSGDHYRHRAFITFLLLSACAASAALLASLIAADATPVTRIVLLTVLAGVVAALFVLRQSASLAKAGIVSLASIALVLGCLFSLELAGTAILVLLPLLPFVGVLAHSRLVVGLGAGLALFLLMAIGVLPASLDASASLAGARGFALLAVGVSAWLSLKVIALEGRTVRQARADQQKALSLLHCGNELVSRHDLSGATLFASPVSQRLFGVHSSHLMKGGFFDKVHLQDRVAFLKCLSDAHSTDVPQSCTIRFRAKGKGQAWGWVEFTAIPEKDDTHSLGNSETLTGVTRDVSAWKSRIAELEHASASANATFEHRRNMLATISHELRTPLNAIVGFSEILDQELFGALEQKRHREYVGHIRESGQHLLSVVNGMLDVAQIEAGRKELVLETFSLAEVAGQVIAMLEPQRMAGDVQMGADMATALPEISADRQACRQILINLLSNAVKFTPAGGTVTLRLRPFGSSIKIEVRDSGIGMPTGFIERATLPFEQADSGKDRKYQGSGLGLAVVRGLTDLHGGKLTIDSTPGKGTLVTVLLPVKARRSRPVPAESRSDLVHIDPAAEKAARDAKRVPLSKAGDKSVRLSA